MIGWYLHHHGQGHLQRLRGIAPHLEQEVLVFSSLPAPEVLPRTRAGEVGWVRLPGDWEAEQGCPVPAQADPTAGGTLHWAPLRHRGHARRLAALAQHAPELEGMVVDVSAEAAMLSRILGLPTVVVTQPGDRTDGVHRTAYRMAAALLAPFPGPEAVGERALREAAPHCVEFREKTVFTGGISAAGDPPEEAITVSAVSAAAPAASASGASAPAASAQESGASDPVRVLFLGSRGGSLIGPEELARAQAASRAAWDVVGVPGHPWVHDVGPLLARADVVVMNAGMGSIADVARSPRPAILLGQERPFGEQEATCRLLEGIGLTTLRGVPDPGEWDGLIERALAAGTAPWAAWGVRGSGARAARAIEDALGSAGRPPAASEPEAESEPKPKSQDPEDAA